LSKPQKTLFAAGAICILAGISFGALRASAGSSPTPPLMSAESTPAGAISTVESQVIGGQTWSLSTFTNKNGRVCLRQNIPPTAGAEHGGTACADPETLFATGAIHLETDMETAPNNRGEWSNVWVYGWSASGVTDLVAQLRDCTTVPVRIASGVFSHVFPPGHLPQRLIAYQVDGTVMQEVAVSVPPSPSAETATPTTC